MVDELKYTSMFWKTNKVLLFEKMGRYIIHLSSFKILANHLQLDFKLTLIYLTRPITNIFPESYREFLIHT